VAARVSCPASARDKPLGLVAGDRAEGVALIPFFAELIQAKNGWWWRRMCSKGVLIPFFAELPQARMG